ncbi:translation elongation factor Ts [Bacteroidota bacterium]
MEVSIALIKELRTKTGAGMGDCKTALVESNGDIEKAIEYLRKKGALTATKRAAKIANEGAVKSKISDDKKTGVIIEINCETDFVAKGDDFQKFSEDVADIALGISSDELSEILSAKSKDGITVQESFDGLMGKIGEKIEFKKAKLIRVDNGFVSEYNHFGSKLGSIIGIKGNLTDEAYDIGNKIAMQVVAMNPIAIDRDGVEKELIEKEKDIYTTQAKNEKKPENIIDKIVNNKVEKFYQDNCLIEQEFIQDSHKSIKNLLDDYKKKSENELEVVEMIRFQLG